MRYIISKKYRNKYYNEITEYMDGYLKGLTDRYKVYIYDDKFKNRWTLRVPGCSIGYIEVSENDIITNIKIYTRTLRHFHPSILNGLSKFYNMKLIMEDQIECIISEKDNINRYFNEITNYMDKYLKDYNEDFYINYIYEEKVNNRWFIRVPGCTVGCIEVDANDIIYNIRLYDDTIGWYDKEVLDEIDKFYNMKLIME